MTQKLAGNLAEGITASGFSSDPFFFGFGSPVQGTTTSRSLL
jgi:hypothetical protein